MNEFVAGRLRAHQVVLVAVMLVCSVSAGCHRDPRRAHGSNRPTPHTSGVLRELRLDEMPSEQGRPTLGGSGPTLDRVLDSIQTAATVRSVRGLFVVFAPLGRGSARANELIAAFARIRAAHKPIHCHFDVADNAAYFVMARSCDRITVTPAGQLLLIGVAAHLYSVRGLLDWAGVRMEMVQAGEAKGAADPFTRDEPSPEHQANIESLVGDLNAQIEAAVASRIPQANAAELLENGPYTSRGALRAGLVDATVFDDEARSTARAAARARRVVRVSWNANNERMSVRRLLEALTTTPEDEAPDRPHLVLARLTGSIVDGHSSPSGSVAGEPFVAAMRRFASDSNVRAVVLRIDSPGGSALASDRMWHAVYRLALKKPVVVSVGDMAASGGYYVASAATEVFANQDSIVGSIGVVAGRPDLSALLARLSIRMHPVVAAPSADITMPFRPLREDERARFVASADETYARFIDRITLGRHQPRERVEAAAEGRVWTGIRAHELGLVDTIGTLADATARARRLGHLSRQAPIHSWPSRPSLLESLLGSRGNEVSAVALVDPSLAQLLVDASIGLNGPPTPRVALPYALDVR